MREVSSKEYANNVEDVVWGCLSDAIAHAYEIVADIYGFTPKTDEMVMAFDKGFAATWRDQAIDLFEAYGLDVKSDGGYLHMDDVTQDTPCGCYWFDC